MPNLYVALFRPVDGNVKHWALHLEDIGIFQVEGDPMDFALDIQPRATPEDRGGCAGRVFVAEIDDVEGFEQVVRKTEVCNQVAHWNCQNFVLDVLEGLSEDGILGDYEYGEAKEELEGIFDE